MANDEVMLDVRNVSKAFPGTQALDAVSLSVRKGEVHAVLGENGAGKSTLMLILAGVYHKDSGEIVLEGQHIEIRDPHHAQQLGISMVHQDLSLAQPLSVAENMFANRQPLSSLGLIDYRRLYEQTREALAPFDLNIDPRTAVRDLSVALQQVVEIATALSRSAKVLIMDEPTSALTEHETAILFRIIRRLCEQGVTILYISHKLSEVKEIADRFTVLRDGKVVGTLETRQASQDDIVRMMVGREMGQYFPDMGHPEDECLFEVRNLSGPRFSDLSFKLYRGEVLGVAGLAGAGRTDMARAIFGAEPLTSGEILLHGKPVRIHSPADAVSLGLGYVPEDRKEAGLFLSLTVRENTVAASLRQFSGVVFMDHRQVLAAALDMVRNLDIKTPGLEQAVMNLSGGNQQKVMLAKWLVIKPNVLIVDEPTRGVDVGVKADVHRLLRDLANRGVGVIMISSELPEILGMSDRILVMREGHLVGEVLHAEATEERVMSYAAGVEARGLRAVPD
jgi:ABC-type sugar transport system ATPase subunit